MTFLRLNTRLLVALLLFTTSAGVAFLSSKQLLDGPYSRWVEFNVQWSAVSPFVLPLTAAAAGYLAQVNYRDDNVIMGVPAPIPVVRRLLRMVWPIIPAAFLGCLVGLFPVLVMTLRTATSGRFQLRDMVFFLASLLVAVALGVVLAVVTSSVVVIPLALVVAFVWTQLVNHFGDRFLAITPFHVVEPAPGQVLSTWIAVFGTAALIALALSLLFIAKALSEKPLGIPIIAASLGSFMVVLVASVVLPLGSVAPLWDLETAENRTCLDQEDVSVCVHDAHEKELDRIVASVDTVMANYGTVLDTSPVLIDRTLLFSPHELAPHAVVVNVEPGRGAQVGVQLAQWLSGFFACAGQENPGHLQFSQFFQDWLLFGPDTSETPLDSSSFQEFIAQNQNRMQSCEVDISEVRH